MKQLQEEREELFGFTDQDHSAWGQAPADHKHDASFLEHIEQVRQRAPSDTPETTIPPEEEASTVPLELTHLTKDRKSVHMVDVGSKEVTQRKAVAQSRVIFPPEVVQAFSPDWSSSKGPIFDTAVLAGIMAAK